MKVYKKIKGKALIYKWLSVLLLFAELYLTYSTAWFRLSVNSIGGFSNGEVTLIEFQKFLSAIVGYTYWDENDQVLYYLMQGFYLVIVLFLSAIAIEIVFHMLDIDLTGIPGILIFLELVVLVPVMFWSSAFRREGQENTIRFTLYFWMAVFLPFATTVLWEKYLHIKVELAENMSTSEVMEEMNNNLVTASNDEFANKITGRYCPRCGQYMEKPKRYCGFCGYLVEFDAE